MPKAKARQDAGGMDPEVASMVQGGPNHSGRRDRKIQIKAHKVGRKFSEQSNNLVSTQ